MNLLIKGDNILFVDTISSHSNLKYSRISIIETSLVETFFETETR